MIRVNAVLAPKHSDIFMLQVFFVFISSLTRVIGT